MFNYLVKMSTNFCFSQNYIGNRTQQTGIEWRYQNLPWSLMTQTSENFGAILYQHEQDNALYFPT